LLGLRSRSWIIDGEAVCCDDMPSFNRLRHRRDDLRVFLVLLRWLMAGWPYSITHRTAICAAPPVPAGDDPHSPGATCVPMSSRTDPSLQDRLTLAANAKSAMLAKFKRAQDPENPVAIENRRQREAIAAARAEREAQRAAERQRVEAELARQAALAAEAAAKAEREAAEKAAREAAELEAMLKAEQKAARDARYAARKAAKKVRRRGY
jgi:hypothetical protein